MLSIVIAIIVIFFATCPKTNEIYAVSTKTGQELIRDPIYGFSLMNQGDFKIFISSIYDCFPYGCYHVFFRIINATSKPIIVKQFFSFFQVNDQTLYVDENTFNESEKSFNKLIKNETALELPAAQEVDFGLFYHLYDNSAASIQTDFLTFSYMLGYDAGNGFKKMADELIVKQRIVRDYGIWYRINVLKISYGLAYLFGPK